MSWSSLLFATLAAMLMHGPAKATEDAVLVWLFGESDVVFACSVQGMGGCAGLYSGFFPVFQRLDCRVGEVFKGQLPEEETEVWVRIVAGSELLEDGAPCLSGKRFEEGSTHIVFGGQRNGRVEASEQHAVPFERSIAKRLRPWRGRCDAGSQFRRDTPTSRRGGNRTLNWSTTPDGDLVVEHGSEVLNVFGSQLLGRYLGDHYEIESVTFNRRRGLVAIAMQDREVLAFRVVLGFLYGKCPPSLLRPEIPWGDHAFEGLQPGHPKSPVWVSDHELAFLTGFHEETNSAVFLLDLESARVSVLRLEDVPERLYCKDGHLAISGAAGESMLATKCLEG